MKHVRKWLPVPPYDLPGMEGWLEEMAGKGLYLERLKSWTARFRRGKPRPLRFRIQPCCGREREFLLQKPPEDLVELFASFGWQCEGWASSSLVLFSTDDPEAPEPNPDPQTLELALEPPLRLNLMDVMMPKLDGLSAVLKIREQRNLPILILSAKSEDTDKILGLSMGADDYISKPFHPQELVARVRSHLRRYTQLGDVNRPSQKTELVTGRLCYLPDQKTLLADGVPVRLTATELKIVDLLMRNPGRVFPAEEIYRRVWDEEAAYACENTVMVHIRRIREKIELNPREPDYIKVVWGIGYKMEQHGT